LEHQFAAAVASPATMVARMWLQRDTIPSASTRVLTFRNGATVLGGIQLQNTGVLRAFVGAQDAFTTANPTIRDGQGYWLDVKCVLDATRTVDFMVDGVSATQGSTTGGGASACDNISWGMSVASTTDFYVDSLIVSGTAGDYPIGRGAVIGLYPNGDGTHVYSASTDFAKEGTANTACAFPVAGETTSWQSLTNPLSTTIDNTKFVTDLAGLATEWLEWTLADLPSSVASVNGLMAVTTNHSVTATANNVGMKLVDGATTSNVYPTDVADFSELGIATAVKTFATAPSTGTAWTKTLVDALKIRWGMSTDVAPDPILDGVCLEVDIVPNKSLVAPRQRGAARTLIVR
jgi:hypothetical protein